VFYPIQQGLPMSHSNSRDYVMQIFNVHKGIRVALPTPPALSRPATLRLRWLDWHRGHSNNVSLTCRHFGISRSTFYRWHARYEPRRIVTLEDKSHAPQHRRQPTWTSEQKQAVIDLRKQYPRWGKEKLAVLLHRYGLHISESMVGRILADARRRGQLHEPHRLISARKHRQRRPYAIRKPKGYEVTRPGDLVQVDTLDVRPLPGYIHKHFSLVDCVSRYALTEIRGRATARTAQESLALMLARAPFPIRAIQVDGGSEFMAEFEDFCQQREIRLFVLPPRSPKLNGQVERSQRTHTEEFYECTDAGHTVGELARALANWEVIYNTIRPHKALGLLTPWEFLQINYPDQFQVEKFA
jgi:putative transposase